MILGSSWFENVISLVWIISVTAHVFVIDYRVRRLEKEKGDHR